jgi:hypothetical protein
MKVYKVITGIDYRTSDGEKRANPGDKVNESDLPKRSISWLVTQGIIVQVEGKKSSGEEDLVADDRA